MFGAVAVAVDGAGAFGVVGVGVSVGAAAAVSAAATVTGDDAVGQRPLDRPAVPGADQQRERQHRGDRAPQRAHDQAQQVGDSADGATSLRSVGP